MHRKDCITLRSPCLYICSIRMCTDLTCLFYHAVPGRLAGGAGPAGRGLPGWERGPAPPALAAAQVEAWLEGHAAAGSDGPCRRFQECSAPSPSRVLSCRLCHGLTFAESNFVTV